MVEEGEWQAGHEGLHPKAHLAQLYGHRVHVPPRRRNCRLRHATPPGRARAMARPLCGPPPVGGRFCARRRRGSCRCPPPGRKPLGPAMLSPGQASLRPLRALDQERYRGGYCGGTREYKSCSWSYAHCRPRSSARTSRRRRRGRGAAPIGTRRRSRVPRLPGSCSPTGRREPS